MGVLHKHSNLFSQLQPKGLRSLVPRTAHSVFFDGLSLLLSGQAETESRAHETFARAFSQWFTRHEMSQGNSGMYNTYQGQSQQYSTPLYRVQQQPFETRYVDSRSGPDQEDLAFRQQVCII
jgi:hypothetical protein